MLHYVLSGFAVGLSLIIAIGAQNAFVLKQGLKRQHVFWVCVVCALSDTLLIMLGVFGFSHVLELYPYSISVARYVGAAFLFFYGLQHVMSAIRASGALNPSEKGAEQLLQVILVCLALTWLNPHVYLDTVVLIGSVSTQYIAGKWWFALGAALASWMFFFILGYGAKFLLPWFKKPQAWRILDALIAITMWAIALSLVLHA